MCDFLLQSLLLLMAGFGGIFATYDGKGPFLISLGFAVIAWTILLTQFKVA